MIFKCNKLENALHLKVYAHNDSHNIYHGSFIFKPVRFQSIILFFTTLHIVSWTRQIYEKSIKMGF